MLTVAALLVRALALVLEPPVAPVADERTWTDWARHLASDKVHFSPLRTRRAELDPKMDVVIQKAEEV